MIFFALTPSGLKEAIGLATQRDAAVWCSADAISESDFKKYVSEPEHISITRFTQSFAHASSVDVGDAVATIVEHHPSEKIWMEMIGNTPIEK
jgi:hypothetical protein